MSRQEMIIHPDALSSAAGAMPSVSESSFKAIAKVLRSEEEALQVQMEIEHRKLRVMRHESNKKRVQIVNDLTGGKVDSEEFCLLLKNFEHTHGARNPGRLELQILVSDFLKRDSKTAIVFRARGLNEDLDVYNLCKEENVWVLELLSHCLSSAQDSSLSVDVLEIFEGFLAKRWQLIRGTPLAYTYTPESDLTKFLIKLAEKLVRIRESLGLEPRLAYQLLMPSLELTDYESDMLMDPLESLSLHQFVLSSTGLYRDRPIDVLYSLRCLLTDPEGKLRHTTSFEGEVPFLSELDLKQVTEHSVRSLNFYQAYEHYRKLKALSSGGVIPGCGLAIELLIQALRAGSASGDGSDEFASAKAVDGIEAFRVYLRQLPLLQRERLFSLSAGTETFTQLWQNLNIRITVIVPNAISNIERAARVNLKIEAIRLINENLTKSIGYLVNYAVEQGADFRVIKEAIALVIRDELYAGDLSADVALRSSVLKANIFAAIEAGAKRAGMVIDLSSVAGALTPSEAILKPIERSAVSLIKDLIGAVKRVRSDVLLAQRVMDYLVFYKNEINVCVQLTAGGLARIVDRNFAILSGRELALCESAAKESFRMLALEIKKDSYTPQVPAWRTNEENFKLLQTKLMVKNTKGDSAKKRITQVGELIRFLDVIETIPDKNKWIEQMSSDHLRKIADSFFAQLKSLSYPWNAEQLSFITDVLTRLNYSHFSFALLHQILLSNALEGFPEELVSLLKRKFPEYQSYINSISSKISDDLESAVSDYLAIIATLKTTKHSPGSFKRLCNVRSFASPVAAFVGERLDEVRKYAFISFFVRRAGSFDQDDLMKEFAEFDDYLKLLWKTRTFINHRNPDYLAEVMHKAYLQSANETSFEGARKTLSAYVGFYKKLNRSLELPADILALRVKLIANLKRRSEPPEFNNSKIKEFFALEDWLLENLEDQASIFKFCYEKLMASSSSPSRLLSKLKFCRQKTEYFQYTLPNFDVIDLQPKDICLRLFLDTAAWDSEVENLNFYDNLVLNLNYSYHPAMDGLIRLNSVIKLGPLHCPRSLLSTRTGYEGHLIKSAKEARTQYLKGFAERICKKETIRAEVSHEFHQLADFERLTNTILNLKENYKATNWRNNTNKVRSDCLIEALKAVRLAYEGLARGVEVSYCAKLLHTKLKSIANTVLVDHQAGLFGFCGLTGSRLHRLIKQAVETWEDYGEHSSSRSGFYMSPNKDGRHGLSML